VKAILKTIAILALLAVLCAWLLTACIFASRSDNEWHQIAFLIVGLLLPVGVYIFVMERP